MAWHETKRHAGMETMKAARHAIGLVSLRARIRAMNDAVSRYASDRCLVGLWVGKFNPLN